MEVIIITHGDLARTLLETVNTLLPVPMEARTFSNRKMAIDTIIRTVTTEHVEAKELLVFTDFRGGSCWQAAFRIKQALTSATVISGVNIPMLISFGINRERLQGAELIKKITEDAIKSIQTF